MQNKKRNKTKEKPRLHPRNKNRERYNFTELIENSPDLGSYVKMNIHNDESIDFADPSAVKALNKALLKYYYRVHNWDIPKGYLCPPIPGRADYIHHIADLLCSNNYGKIPKGENIKCLDIGVGANCIYPLIGNTEYGWSFIGSDIDEVAIDSANKIISSNDSLHNKIECRLQKDPNDFFYGIIKKDEIIDLSICNPPFHATAIEAESATNRKQRNLSSEKVIESNLNFGGQNNELWYKGGEIRFVGNMIRQSKKFYKNCFWFSSLISKQSNLQNIYSLLKEIDAIEVVTLPMGQGNKSSRVVAWTFLTKEEQKNWKNTRWKQ